MGCSCLRWLACLSDTWADVVLDNTNVTFDVFRPAPGGEVNQPPVDDDNDPDTPPVPATPTYVYQDDSGALVYVYPDYEDDDYVAPAGDDETTDEPGSTTVIYPSTWKIYDDTEGIMSWDTLGQTSGVTVGNDLRYEQYARITISTDLDIRLLDIITDINFMSGDKFIRGNSYWVRGITPVIGPLGSPIAKELYVQYVLRSPDVA